MILLILIQLKLKLLPNSINDRNPFQWKIHEYSADQSGLFIVTRIYAQVGPFHIFAFCNLIRRGLLELNKSSGIDDLGRVKWDVALCLLVVYLICYFSLWKGISTSGKVHFLLTHLHAISS